MGASPRDPVLTALSDAPLELLGVIGNASNHTVLAQLGPAEDERYAVYKPRGGERPLWDFPDGTLHRREVAAFVVSDALGWGIVPPTVLRDGPLGIGSVQLFVPHDPAEHYFVLVEQPEHRTALARLATFDLLVNNADRKGGHVLLADDGTIRGIDHGLTFHVQPKLRTVVWDLGPAPIEPVWQADLRRLAARLDDAADPVTAALEDLLAGAEVAMLQRRARLLAGTPALPVLDEQVRPYPWPPL
jgi:uncharacterized repeat protein (TIGR03843 family)